MFVKALAIVTLAGLVAQPALATNASITINVDAAANRHPIDPRIYGVAWAPSTATLIDLGATMNRWGGKAMSRYNWAFSTANAGRDHYFENIPHNVSSGDGSYGKSADDFIGLTKAAGATPIITIPMMGWLPKDRSNRCGYLISKYGQQDEADWARPDCGNGMSGGQRLLHVNDPNDTSAVYPPSHQREWVYHLGDTWGSPFIGGIRYYSLDNEPSLWSADHWDVHPNGSTYDEVWTKMAEYGATIRAVNPAAIITGIEEWGWTGYFLSGLDQETGDGADRAAHDGVNYVEWLLQQAAAYENTHRERILDVAALHYYPQGGEFGNDTSLPMQGKRNRSTRSLWDPNYIDESWIGDDMVEGGIVRLIPRLRAWVAANYPGTQTGITEYNWGADYHINGATAQADVLGIFGRERLDIGVRSTTPAAHSAAYNAFKMYRNYDGNQSRFGDLTVSANAPDPDNVSAFAALRSSDEKMTVMVIAKTHTGSTPVTVNLANFPPSGPAERWQLDSGNAITRLADVAVAGSSLSLTVPAQSITLLVIPGSYVDTPVRVVATATGLSTAVVSWQRVGGLPSYRIYRSSMNGPFTHIGTTTERRFDDNSLSPNTAYLYKVQAVVGAVASSLSEVDATNTVLTQAQTSGWGISWRHLENLRAAVNALRAAVGWDAIAFAPVSRGTKILAAHIVELRQALDAVRAAIGVPPLTYKDRPIRVGMKVRAQHWTELHTGMK